MNNLFNENFIHGKILLGFPSLLGSTSQLDINGGRYPRSATTQTGEPSRILLSSHEIKRKRVLNVKAASE